MYATVLWFLLFLFCLRVAGQALVATFAVPFLPPMQQWYSGVIPYPILLPLQILIIVLLAKVATDFTRRRGFFVVPRRTMGRLLQWFSYLYWGGMAVRYVVSMALHPERRWLGGRREGDGTSAYGAPHRPGGRRGVCGLLRAHVVHHTAVPRGGGVLSPGRRIPAGRVVRRVCARAGAGHFGRHCRARPHVHRSRGATSEDRTARYVLQSQRAVPSDPGGGPVASLPWLAEAPC